MHSERVLQSHMNSRSINPTGFCNTLDEVLADGDALQVFLTWAHAENAADPLLFHFSVVAYKEMTRNEDEKARKLAGEIYNRYVDHKHGACRFLDRTICDEIAKTLAQSSKPEIKLFDSCLPFIDVFLRRQHAQFVTSDAFLEFINTIRNDPTSQPSTSAQVDQAPVTQSNTSTNRRTTRNRQKQPTEPLSSNKRLTPAVLMRSQRERERLLGQSSVEKMFQPPIFKYPYVCQANPSKNDSAVSSNFSSEAGSSQHRTFAPASTLQHTKVPQPPPHRRCAERDGTSAFRHDTEEGRCEFATSLIKRLCDLDEKINRSERLNEQIKKIEGRTVFSARDVVISQIGMPTHGAVDEDEDVDNYVKQRMIVDDSGKPSPSQQQSPATVGQLIHARQQRRRSPKSCSPDPPTARSKFNPMSQSCFDQYNNRGLHGGILTTKIHEIATFGNSPRSQFPMSYYDHDDLSSGIGSMATTSSITRRERHQPKSVKSTRQHHHEFASLPRQRGTTNSTHTMKISYRSSDGVPIVAQIPRQRLTFREFRNLLSISSKTRKQFFFKSECEEAPYQLQLINDDSAVLPLFQGEIAAECRSLSDSD
ncbi:hypothetical protein M3Y94_00530900 [Aphelenchoides besseyi]|nr:hypothetical protein M3Y94_00530900 [Aphelenchoides besseyi]KAI6225862.1 hypothetical protein M3Y95_00741900 [Aphelenchoides besseyi]